MTHFSAVHLPELQGINNELSHASDGGIVWNDINYAFVTLPSFLVRVPFFQLPRTVHQNTVMTVQIYLPSTIYISTFSAQTRGFDGSLPNDGWIQEKGQIKTNASHSCCRNSSAIWKKSFLNLNNGLTTATLPATTSSLVGVIFIAGNNFKM